MRSPYYNNEFIAIPIAIAIAFAIAIAIFRTEIIQLLRIVMCSQVFDYKASCTCTLL